MSRSKKNWDQLIDFFGNYTEVDRDVGVARVLGGDGIMVNPPRGVGTVTVSVDPAGGILQKGDAISELDNDAGYISGVDQLDDIGDVSAPSPKKGQVLTWSGTQWTSQTAGIPEAFNFRGKIDCSTQNPEADPREGWTYIQSTGSGLTPLPSWVGITSETVDENDLIVYSAAGEWTLLKGVLDATGFQDLNAQNSPTPKSGEPNGYLEYDENTATFTYYPPAFAELPDLTDPNLQPGTLDDRYVNVVGDTMTGTLNMSGQNIEAAGDLRLEGALYLNGANTIGNDNVRSIIAEGGVLDFGLRDSTIDTAVVGVSVRRHTNDKVYLHLAEEPVLPTMAVPLAFLLDTLGDLEDDLDDKYVLAAGDTMTGTLTFDNVGQAFQFNGNTSINTEGNKTLTFTNSGSPRLLVGQQEVVVRNKPFRVQNTDNSYLLTVAPGATQDEAVARYSGKINDSDDITNKKYVDDGDEVLASEIDSVKQDIADLELGIPEAEADLKYLHDIVVADTIDIPHGQPAEVTAANKNELTFKIPGGAAGAQGQKGQAGQKGDRGPNGVDGQKGIDGVIGKDGAKGEKGAPGATGGNGTNGAKGQKGQKGADADGKYVTRGNTGSAIRIYYSGGRYYIAGTS